MKHNNAYLARQRRNIDREIEVDCLIAQQQMMDAVMIAAADVFGMGKGRAVKFYAAIKANLMEICELTDQDTTKELWETQEKVDRRLKEIVGVENFTPWSERYKF